MASIDKLIKYLNSDTKNVTEFLDEEDLREIAEKVITGYEVDDKSRSNWLDVNKRAMDLINGQELINEAQKDFPIPNSAKVVYPLIQNAVIQLASQMIMHVVRNDKVAECAVLGKDEQRLIPNPNYQPQQQPQQQVQQPQEGPNQQPPQQQGPNNSNQPFITEWRKAAKAKRVSDFLSYECLIKSDSWLEEEHRLNHIVAAWGVGFKEIYYDAATDDVCSELLSPEDVIINNNLTGSIEKARRITIRQYLTKNDILEQIRAGYFCDIDWEDVESNKTDNEMRKNDSEDPNPTVECLKQFCYLDLDDDDYEEPYTVYLTHDKRKVLRIQPAFEFEDIKINPKNGRIISIRPTINIADRHLISSADGKYYSYGLNHLLFHQNKSITTILRQLLDAGTLANAAASTGFVAKSLKTRERTLRISMGQYIPVDLPQGVNLDTQIMNLPVKEPSQVLLALLQLLIETAKESGFISDILTGQTQMQNVPATTQLSSIEQATRSFKPVVQKLFRSLKKEFKIWFDMYSKYLDVPKYVRFQNQEFEVVKDDFDKSLDIVPVADPTMSSEGHRFARLQAMLQMMQNVPGSTNIQEGALRFYTDLQFPNPEALVAPPPQPQPDPKLIEAQTKQAIAPLEQQNKQMDHQIKMYKAQADHKKVDIKAAELGIKQQQAKVQQVKTIVDAHKEAVDAHNEQQLTKIEAFNADTERQRVEILDRESRKPDSTKGSTPKN